MYQIIFMYLYIYHYAWMYVGLYTKIHGIKKVREPLKEGNLKYEMYDMNERWDGMKWRLRINYDHPWFEEIRNFNIQESTHVGVQ